MGTTKTQAKRTVLEAPRARAASGNLGGQVFADSGATNDSPPNRIRELRDTQHLSVRDLAEKSGVDSATINRMERGTQPLDYPRGKRIAAALGVRFSGILLDQDVELRASEQGNAILAELGGVPEDAWPEMIAMARQMVSIVRQTAAQHTAGALGGDPRQVRELAEIWRGFDDLGRDRAIKVLQLIDQPAG